MLLYFHQYIFLLNWQNFGSHYFKGTIVQSIGLHLVNKKVNDSILIRIKKHFENKCALYIALFRSTAVASNFAIINNLCLLMVFLIESI